VQIAGDSYSRNDKAARGSMVRSASKIVN
jgi:hypothetical protein